MTTTKKATTAWIATAGLMVGLVAAGCSDPKPDTLYQRLGGESGINTVIGAFIGRVAGDNKINGYFFNSSVSLAKLQSCLVLQIGSLTGGPNAYPGSSGCRDMKTAHAGLGISMQDFTDLAGHLVAALQAAGVAQADVDTIVAAVTPTATDIVEDASNNKTVYQRLGRKPAIKTVIDAFVGKVAANPKIMGFFGATNIDRLKTCLVRQVCSIDGPCNYGEEIGATTGEFEPGVSAAAACRDMKTTHTGLMNGTNPITVEDFNSLVGDLVAVIPAGVSDADKTALLTVLGSFCKDIVKDGTGCPQ